MGKVVKGCGTLSLMRILGKKWSIPILELFFSERYSELHFNAIQSRVGNITPRNLSQSLEELNRAGILSKTTGDDGPIYYLTENGYSLQKFVTGAKELGISIYGMDPFCVNRKCVDCAKFRNSS